MSAAADPKSQSPTPAGGSSAKEKAAETKTIKLGAKPADDDEKLKARAERFAGASSDADLSADKKRKVDPTSDEAQKKRAERFGLPFKGSKGAAELAKGRAAKPAAEPQAPPAVDDEKLRQRAIRFGMIDPAEEEKRKKRAERFAAPPPTAKPAAAAASK